MKNYTNKIKHVITKDEPHADIKCISSFPADYQNLMLKDKSFEFMLSNNNSKSFTIWSLFGKGGALEMNEAFEIKSKFGEKVFAIGSDNGDRLIIYVILNNEYSLYLIEDYDFDLDDATFLSKSLDDLLYNGTNIEKIHE